LGANGGLGALRRNRRPRGGARRRGGPPRRSNGPLIGPVAPPTGKPAPPGPNHLRIIPMGGLGEIGLNCMALEYGNDIIIIDVGLMFPDQTMPGVDLVIPDVSYLEARKDRIRGIFITHAHLDHIGGAPYLVPKLGFPPVYATRLADGFIKAQLEEHKLDRRVQVNTFKFDDKIKAGVFTVEAFHINHNIPEGVGFAITTPLGVVTHSGDFKFDKTPIADTPAEFDKIKRIGEHGVLLAMNDSTNVEKPGRTVSEIEIEKNLIEQISKAKGRVIMSTFASLVSRLQEAIDAAEKNGRKVCIVGRSMLKNVEICQRLGYIKIPKGILVDVRKLKGIPDRELLVICTGSQATEFSALLRMSTGEHAQIQIKQGDTVILSSSPVPGNERAVESMMDDLFRLGADVIYNKMYDIHTSGHAQQDELREMIQMLRPKHFMPIHGEYRKRVLHGRIANEEGIPPANVHILDNGRVLEVKGPDRVELTKERAGGGLVLVDGLGVGDIGQVVLRDRQHMAEDGMLVAIITVDRRSGQLIGSPDIISRGFVYLKESGKLMGQVRGEIKRMFKGAEKRPSEWSATKNKVRDDLGDFLYAETERRPMVIPVIIEV
ncbi:MAG: ribonuclease J, partial [Patescibacteria group bacterium]